VFVKNKLHTISTGQSTHYDFVKNLACGAFWLISLACGAFCFTKNLACGALFSYFCCSNRDAFDLKIFVLSTNSLVVKMIPTQILSDHNDIICTKQ